MITGFSLPIRLCLLVLLVGTAGSSVAATYKCWTNDEGVRECGQTVPPEYSQQRIEVLNDRGIVIRVEEPAKTPEQLEAEKRAEEQRKLEEQRKAEQRRRDRVLLNTFTTERDLRLYYQDKITAIQSLINIIRSNKDSLGEKLNELQKRAANMERRGEKLSDNLLQEMEQVKRQIKNNNDQIKEKQQELNDINKRFEKELDRFQELTAARSGQGEGSK